MIISASRRTDIPAFYTEWFLNRVKEGWMIVMNPFNPNQANIVPLNRNDVDCYVFWTKNPRPMLDRIDELDELVGGSSYYFQFTLNGYGRDIEPGLPPREDRIRTFQELSSRIGKEKTIWRYDPVIINDNLTIDWHGNMFNDIADNLHEYTEKCVFSYVDPYKKTMRNMVSLNIGDPSGYPMGEIAENFSETARKYGLELSTCCEKIDLGRYGITHNRCIDDRLIKRITGRTVPDTLDGQRENCGCVKCKDIGANETCRHNCLYCYANRHPHVADEFVQDPNSPILGQFGDRRIFDGTDGQVRLYYEGKLVTDIPTWLSSRRKRPKTLLDF